MPSDVDNDAPRPRLCHLVKWADFNGFGFNLHAEKAKFGQFIGKVDEGSPAECAGLREGDRIIEVNGVNVSNENHKQVVERIKAIPYETKLLVVDLETDKYYKSKKIVVKGNQANIVVLKTPASRGEAVAVLAGAAPNSNGGEGKTNGSAADYDADERRSQASSIASDRESLNQDADKISRNGSNMSTPPIGRNEDGSRSNGSRSPGTPPPLTPPGGAGGQLSRTVSSDSAGDKSLNLNMTASEMRAMLANKKKYDPKKENLDLRKKHAIIQDM